MPPTNEPDAPTKTPRRTRASFLSYHARRCSICRHREREMIDDEFLHWIDVASIAETYEIERRAIYRHAHATGLFGRRNREVRFALGHIIEQAQSVEVTADSIIRAVRLFACLTDDGELINPARRAVHEPSRSTHLYDLNASQVGENTAPAPAQIDTNSHV